MKHTKKLLALLLVLLMVLALVPVAAVTASAAGNICEIVGGSSYATLDAAIDAVENGQTIRLLADVVLNDELYFGRKRTYTFDTNNKTLDFGGGGIIVVNYESVVTINGCAKLANLGYVRINGNMLSYGIPLYKTVFNGDLTIRNEFEVAGYAQVEVNGNMTFKTANGWLGTSYDGGELAVKGNITVDQLDSSGIGIGVGRGSITIDGNIVTYGVLASINGGKLAVKGDVTASGVCGAYFFANGGSIYINGAYAANEAKVVGFTDDTLDHCVYSAKTQHQSTVNIDGVKYRQYTSSEHRGALYAKAYGNFIFNTTYESNVRNWLLFFLGFGFIWMWFV